MNAARREPRMYIDRDALAQNIEKMRKKLCVYIGNRCDCKFGGDNPGRSEQGSGCPELYQVLALLRNMTKREYDMIMKRGWKSTKSRARRKAEKLPGPSSEDLVRGLRGFYSQNDWPKHRPD
jgi:hypothetical protein